MLPLGPFPVSGLWSLVFGLNHRPRTKNHKPGPAVKDQRPTIIYKDFSHLTDDRSIVSSETSKFPATLAGLYIHVPFCRAKCPYCDFYSVTDPGLISAYIEALLAELNMRRQQVHLADTIYFGGGTPSILTPLQIAQILEGVHTCFSVTPDAEITLEVNPETVNQAALASYREAGINRLNIGLQSLNDATLKFLGRIHTAEKGVDTYRWARASGFDNIGVDLIYGVPGQTRSLWETEMAGVVGLAPDHLSCYTLTIKKIER